MEFTALRAQLDHEFALLRAAVAATPAGTRVPTCPDWSVADLAGHVAEVYRHKAAAIRLNDWPRPWPPERPAVAPETDLDLAYAELVAELDAHLPADPAATWHEPDQTVGFWIRRMAQETVVHRVDAETAGDSVLTRIDEDLALDGIDEILRIFFEFGSHALPEDYGRLLDSPDPRPIGISAGRWHWTVAATPKGLDVGDSTAAEVSRCAAKVSGTPDSVLLWLWNRTVGQAVAQGGDDALLAQFAELRTAGTQ